VSSTLQDPEWENTTVLRGDPEEVRALKAMPGDLDITATGSMQLVTALVASGLVDEYRLFVCPFRGRRGSAPVRRCHRTWRSPPRRGSVLPLRGCPAPLPPVRADDHALSDTASASRQRIRRGPGETPPDSVRNGRADPAETPLRTAHSWGCSQSRCADQAAPRPVRTRCLRAVSAAGWSCGVQNSASTSPWWCWIRRGSGEQLPR
jgi:hypothetical protein